MKLEDHNRDSFEEMLKETADRFCMYPSGHVWFSLYNNLHPSKIWPSAGSWLLFFLFFIIMDPSQNYKMLAGSRFSNTYPPASETKVNSGSDHHANMFKASAEARKISSRRIMNDHNAVTANVKTARNKTNRSAETESSSHSTAELSSRDFNKKGQFNLISALKQPEQRKKNYKFKTERNQTLSASAYQVIYRTMPLMEENSPNPGTNSVRENNRSSGKFGYEIYATPSVGFRGLSKTNSVKQESDLAAPNAPANENESSPAYMPAFNMEAGGSISYAFSEVMRFKAGVQLNYSKQNIDADNANQRNATQQEMNNQSPAYETRSIEAMDGPGSDKRILTSRSYQVSLPLGADVKIADAENIEWFAGASVQPTLILPGNSFSFNSAESFLPDAGAIRNWNINGGIETFISYHAGKGIRLNAGPQFRYQILSTYKNQYIYNERLYNVGFKLGISSRF